MLLGNLKKSLIFKQDGAREIVKCIAGNENIFSES